MKRIIINSSQIDEVSVVLQTETQKKEKISTAKNIRGSQVILQSIDTLLKNTQIPLHEIDEISIQEGPGSYTGLRVGASIGNTIAFCLGISINGKKNGEFVYPSYE